MDAHYISTSNFPRLAHDTFFDDYDRTISGAKRNNLGAFRGFMFAILIEGSLALLAGVGWELWKLLS